MMKKLVAILMLMAFSLPITAQVTKIPSRIEIQKREIASRSTGHRGYNKVKIDVKLTNTEGKGETLNFTSNTNIEKVEISFVSQPGSKQTAIYNDNTKDGFFYLESGAYKGGQTDGYLLHFYVKGFDKPVWVCVLTKKQ